MWPMHFFICVTILLSYKPGARGTAPEQWNWSKCSKEERVPNQRISEEKLHRLSAATGDEWSFSEIMGRVVEAFSSSHEDLKSWQLRTSIRGDGAAYITISRERPLDFKHGIYFGIDIYKNEAGLFLRDSNLELYKVLQTVPFEPALSYSQDTLVTVNISDGALEVRFGNSSTPQLIAWDYRLSQMKYFGFSTYYNTRGHATFKYGC